MSRSTPLRFVLALSLASPLLSQVTAEQARKIRKEGLENSHAMEFLDHLTNSIGGRLTGSDNFTRACEWAKGEFEKMGLEARLEVWDTWKVVWNRGQWSGRVLEPEAIELQIATPAWTPGTKGRQRGELVKMPPIAKIEQGAFAGKFLLGNIPMFRDPKAPKWRAAVERSGAIGVVGPPSGGRDGRYDTQIRVFGNSHFARGSLDSVPKVPEICVRPDQYERLLKLVKAEQAPVLEFEIRNRFRNGPIPLHNVIADLKGTEKPDEMVIVCGHLDSWHQAAGATDNGTGTCSTLEAARILTAAGIKPKRTIRFILWGGEEQGLLGSKRYVTMHRQEMANVSAVFNHDSGTNWAQRLTVSDAMAKVMRKAMAPVFGLPAPQEGWEDRPFVLNSRPQISAGGGSDHASFGVAGVPAFSWGLQSRDNTPYGYGWHSQWDTYDIAVPKYQAHTSTVIALTAAGVANLKGLLTREGIVRGGGSRGRGNLDVFVGALFGAEMKGATFKKVKKDGPAAAAGVKAGDKIVALNGEPIGAMFAVFGPLRDGSKKMTITVARGEKKVKIEFATEDLKGRVQMRGNRRGNRRGDRRRGGGDQGGTKKSGDGERRRRGGD